MAEDKQTQEAKELYAALLQRAKELQKHTPETPARNIGVPTTPIRISTGKPEPAEQHKVPLYEFPVFLAFFPAGLGIVLTVVAAMKHDIRWLLWFAAPALSYRLGRCLRIGFEDCIYWVWY